MNKIWSTLAGASLALIFSGSAYAGTLEIQISGANLTYNGSSICDAGGCAGGNGSLPGSTANTDSLITANFIVDGSLVGSLSNDIYFDLLIGGVSGILDTGNTVFADHTGFGFDLLSAGGGVLVDFDFGSDVSVTFVPLGGALDLVLGGGAANIHTQLLPFNLEFYDIDDITVSFSTQIDVDSLTTEEGFVTGFTSSGTGEISGIGGKVPEPGILGLFGFGLLGMGIAARRRRMI